jgi:hypothetical protein
MNNPTPLEIDFHKEMLDIYRNAKEECGYNATRFLQMVSNDGGLKTAQKLLATSEPSDGFTVLWENGRLDLTVENLVLNPIYQELFSSEEISKAKTRLEEYGYLK